MSIGHDGISPFPYSREAYPSGLLPMIILVGMLSLTIIGSWLSNTINRRKDKETESL